MLNLRLLPEVYASLQLEAANVGVSVPAYIARLLTMHTQRRKV